MGYTRQALTGFSWNSILTVGTALLTAVKLAVLARLLDQRDFGLFALVAIALGLAESVTQTGVNITIIQAKESVKYFVNTAWVIAITRGWIIGIVMVLLGLGMSRFYQEPELLMMVSVAAFVPIIKGFINPAIVSMQKELRFFRDSVYRFSLVFAETVFAIALGWYLQSVWALIGAIVAAAIYEVVISFALFKIRPAFEYIPSRAKTIFKHAKGLSISAALSYISENIDDLILGRVLGTSPLGLYHTGYALSHRPTQGVAQAVNTSSLPVFARIQKDVQRHKRAFWRTFLGVAALLVVVLIPLVFLPGPVVRFVLGEKWLDVIPLLPWLGLAGALQALTTVCYTALISKTEYKLLNLHQFLSLALFIPLFLFGSTQFGLLGAVMVWTITRLVMFPVALFAVIRRFE